MAAPTELEAILTRLRAGDATARPELYQLVYQQMRRIAGRILAQSFPTLHSYHDVTSIVHDAWFNLDRALTRVDLTTEADFYAFVAHKVRQVLLTLIGKRQRRRLPMSGEELASDSSASGIVVAAQEDSADQLSQWSELHTRAEQLPEPQRQIFALHYYLELPQSQIADLLQMTPKQVSRHWLAATQTLADALF